MRDGPSIVMDPFKRGPTRRGVLWVGLRCDVRCKFCYDERISAADKVWLPYADVTAALDKFRSFYDNDAVDFMGGEPTLHPRILDIVKYSAKIGLRPTVITHGLHLSEMERVRQYAEAGIYDFLISLHAIGDLAAQLHGRDRDNFSRQRQALRNLQELGIPFRFNCVLIRDNLTHLVPIAELAGETGARVVNFLTFNPYFEWAGDGEIEFQARHSDIVPYLERALDRCSELGIEANVRYMPICLLPGREHHVHTGYQLPYDPHEWDYNSWYDMGAAGTQSVDWYYEASGRQRARHNYVHVPACQSCAAKTICDGFHKQYVGRWGGDEAAPFSGPAITDPRHFISHQMKHRLDSYAPEGRPDAMYGSPLATTQFKDAEGNRAGVRPGLPRTKKVQRTAT